MMQLVAVALLVVGGDEPGAGRRDLDDLAVLDQLHPRRLALERGDRRRQEHLTLAHADDERALQPRADEQVRVLLVDDNEREVALELLVDDADGVEQVAPVVALDEVRDHLGVRLRREDVALGLEALLQLAEVLDNPVQRDRDLAPVAARERMRVLLGDLAVRRPARVADAGAGVGAVRLDRLLQVVQVADRADVFEPTVFEQAHTGRVVAPVFEALEAGQNQRLRLPGTDVSDDPAHVDSLSSGCLVRNLARRVVQSR